MSFPATDAIVCADSPRFNGSNDKAIDAILNEMIATAGSKMIVNTAPGTLFSNQWPVADAGRFVGNFNSRVSNAVLSLSEAITTAKYKPRHLDDREYSKCLVPSIPGVYVLTTRLHKQT
jgi:hypothetical protein